MEDILGHKIEWTLRKRNYQNVFELYMWDFILVFDVKLSFYFYHKSSDMMWTLF